MFSQICESCVHLCVRVYVFACLGPKGGVSRHVSLQFNVSFSLVGTLMFLLADLFYSCEVPVMHSLFSKFTDLLAEASCTA